MTVSITTSSIGYDCDGVTASFTYPFRILQESDLTVILTNSVGLETDLVLDVDYSVTGAGSVNGGTVVPLDPASWETGMTLTLERNTELLQETDFVDGEGFSAESIEGCIDKAFLGLQDLDRRMTAEESKPITVTISSVSGGSATVYEIDTSLGAYEFDLPSSGELVVVKKGADANEVTFVADVGQTFNADSEGNEMPFSLTGDRQWVRMVLIGTNWTIIG